MKFFLTIIITFAIFWKTSCNLTPSDFIKCPKNMKAFLVRKNSMKQFCDCQDGFLYNPYEDFCYDAYRQGPCRSGYYFVLPPGAEVATCERNPCRMDGLVPFRGRCYFIWDWGRPCKNNQTFLSVNSENFEIECSSNSYQGNYATLKRSKDCPEHSYLLPKNSDHLDYSCQCESTYIYHAKNNRCYQAYRQGPCEVGRYIVLPEGKREPVCRNNPCQKDGLVPFNNQCHEIYKKGPPCVDTDHKLTVTRDTFQLQCERQYPSGAGAGGIIDAPKKACPAGSRRIVTGCKKIFE